MYFDTPKKNSRKTRSTSKAKVSVVGNQNDKIMQKDKENNYVNIKNGGVNMNNSQNLSNDYSLIYVFF